MSAANLQDSQGQDTASTQDKDTPKIIRPNIFKIILDRTITIAIIASLIVGAILFLDMTVGLETFTDMLAGFGLNPDVHNIGFLAIVAASSAAALIILGSAFRHAKIRYELYDDRLTVYEPAAIIFTRGKDIPLGNIARITYIYDGMMNKILDAGTINLELSGMKDSRQELVYVNRTEETMKDIQKAVQENNALAQMQFQKNHSMNMNIGGNIMRKKSRQS